MRKTELKSRKRNALIPFPNFSIAETSGGGITLPNLDATEYLMILTENYFSDDKYVSLGSQYGANYKQWLFNVSS